VVALARLIDDDVGWRSVQTPFVQTSVSGSQHVFPHFDCGGSQQTGWAQHPAAVPVEQYGVSGGQQPGSPSIVHTSPAPWGQQRCCPRSRQTGLSSGQQYAKGPGIDASPHRSPCPNWQYAPVFGFAHWPAVVSIQNGPQHDALLSQHIPSG
jgi:hypothetical protein